MKKICLPPYPFEKDMWDELAEQKIPIVIYGMGNGADKLIARFEKLNIDFRDIFASDGFVRGHSFHGIRVKSFAEIKDTYSEFIIALSFGSNRPEVIEMLKEIDSEYNMVVPDMPVAGDDYFDKQFYNKNYSYILEAYNALEDDLSRHIFASCIWYKLTGRISYLLDACCTTDDIYSLMGEEPEVIVDAGAYNGDTLREAIGYFKNLKLAHALEPDKRNFKKLARFRDEYNGPVEIIAHNVAAWDRDAEGVFSGSGNRNSSISATSSYEKREEVTVLSRIDTLISDKVDYVKYDVEGAEKEALFGTEKLIRRDHPMLLVSLYHRSEDIFSIINYLKDEYPFYRFFLRRTPSIPAWEIALIAKGY